MEKGSPIPPQVQCITCSMVSFIMQSLLLILYPRPRLNIMNKIKMFPPMDPVYNQLLNCSKDHRIDIPGLQWTIRAASGLSSGRN